MMCDENDLPRKIAVFNAMARCISENWPDWELIANVPGYGTDDKKPVRGIVNIGLFFKGKFAGHRLLYPEDDAVRLMKEICGAFVSAMDKTEVKDARKKA